MRRLVGACAVGRGHVGAVSFKKMEWLNNSTRCSLHTHPFHPRIWWYFFSHAFFLLQFVAFEFDLLSSLFTQMKFKQTNHDVSRSVFKWFQVCKVIQPAARVLLKAYPYCAGFGCCFGGTDDLIRPWWMVAFGVFSFLSLSPLYRTAVLSTRPDYDDNNIQNSSCSRQVQVFFSVKSVSDVTAVTLIICRREARARVFVAAVWFFFEQVSVVIDIYRYLTIFLFKLHEISIFTDEISIFYDIIDK